MINSQRVIWCFNPLGLLKLILSDLWGHAATFRFLCFGRVTAVPTLTTRWSQITADGSQKVQLLAAEKLLVFARKTFEVFKLMRILQEKARNVSEKQHFYSSCCRQSLRGCVSSLIKWNQTFPELLQWVLTHYLPPLPHFSASDGLRFL